MKFYDKHHNNYTRAKKVFHCNITNKVINIGDWYTKVNFREVGNFQFHESVDDYTIENYIMNEHLIPSLSLKERDLYPIKWDARKQEILDSIFNEE